METFRQIIKRHNKLFSHRNKQKIHNLCNWRDKNNFSMNGNFRVENVVYKGVVSVMKMFTLALLRAIGSSATSITPCQSEIRNLQMTQMTQPLPLLFFSWELKKSTRKPKAYMVSLKNCSRIFKYF